MLVKGPGPALQGRLSLEYGRCVSGPGYLLATSWARVKMDDRTWSVSDRERIPEKCPIIVCMLYEQRGVTDRNCRIRNTGIEKNGKEKQEEK